MDSSGLQLVLTTCPDTESAEQIARALVSERLAACVNILPVAQSIYRWKGKVESAAEQLLLIKSRSSDYAAIEQRIVALHPYELPEVLVVPIAAGLAKYLAWVDNPDNFA